MINQTNMINVSTATSMDLLIADIQGKIKYTVLPARRAKKSELVMSSTKGVRTNTNRRGQTTPQATHAHRAVIEGAHSAYFKTSG